LCTPGLARHLHQKPAPNTFRSYFLLGRSGGKGAISTAKKKSSGLSFFSFLAWHFRLALVCHVPALVQGFGSLERGRPGGIQHAPFQISIVTSTATISLVRFLLIKINDLE
jgi:hypothetical protein